MTKLKITLTVGEGGGGQDGILNSLVGESESLNFVINKKKGERKCNFQTNYTTKVALKGVI